MKAVAWENTVRFIILDNGFQQAPELAQGALRSGLEVQRFQPDRPFFFVAAVLAGNLIEATLKRGELEIAFVQRQHFGRVMALNTQSDSVTCTSCIRPSRVSRTIL